MDSHHTWLTEPIDLFTILFEWQATLTTPENSLFQRENLSASFEGKVLH